MVLGRFVLLDNLNGLLGVKGVVVEDFLFWSSADKPTLATTTTANNKKNDKWKQPHFYERVALTSCSLYHQRCIWL